MVQELTEGCDIRWFYDPDKASLHPGYLHSYAHFETNVKHHETKVVAFEIRATGGLTDDDVKCITDIYKQRLQKQIKISTLLRTLFTWLHLAPNTFTLPGNTSHWATLLTSTHPSSCYLTQTYSNQPKVRVIFKPWPLILLTFCNHCGMAPFIFQ